MRLFSRERRRKVFDLEINHPIDPAIGIKAGSDL
jgi:hypothetical protein